MKSTKRIAILVGALAFAVPVSAGMLEIDRTIEASPGGTVEIEMIAGSVRLVGWDKNQVRITGTLNEESEELDIDAESGYIEIEVDLIGEKRRRNRGPSAELEIRLPRDSNLEVGTISAPVRVRDVSGPIEIETISGGIEVEGSSPELDLTSISGRIEVETDVETDLADIETVSGDVDIRSRLTPRARVDVESVNGDITLRLPANTSAQFRVDTFNGKITNEFGPEAERTSRYLPAQHLSCKSGAGGARVEIESFNGTVRLLHD